MVFDLDGLKCLQDEHFITVALLSFPCGITVSAGVRFSLNESKWILNGFRARIFYSN